jgi:hypothetical protein
MVVVVVVVVVVVEDEDEVVVVATIVSLSTTTNLTRRTSLPPPFLATLVLILQYCSASCAMSAMNFWAASETVFTLESDETMWMFPCQLQPIRSF